MAGRVSSSDISFDDITNGVARFIANKQGWRYQIRRSWDVREIPVSESTIFDYEWKIYPSREHLEEWGEDPQWLDIIFNSFFLQQELPEEDHIESPRDRLADEGVYYILRLSEEGFIFEHSNKDAGDYHFLGHYTHTLFPLSSTDSTRNIPVHLYDSLTHLCSKFRCNHFSVT
jgi:hypothetical protein